MENYIVYAIGILAVVYVVRKIFKKDGGCGCGGGEGNCPKK